MQKITVTYEIEGYKHTVHTFVGSLDETELLEGWAGGEMVEFLQSAKRLLTPRALDSATPCPDCGSKKLGIHSIHCSRYRPPSQ